MIVESLNIDRQTAWVLTVFVPLASVSAIFGPRGAAIVVGSAIIITALVSVPDLVDVCRWWRHERKERYANHQA